LHSLSAASQYASASQSPSSAQEVAQVGACWSMAPVQNTDGYGPQSVASTELSQAVSSSAVPLLEQTESPPQRVWPRTPWHAAGWEHTGTSDAPAGQSASVWQQSPPAQQNPFWQWAEAQSETSSHVTP
jgi:hypothetical protein